MKRSVLLLTLLLMALVGMGQSICDEFVVRFGKNKHDLSQEAIWALNSLVAKQDGDLLVELTGHTDSSNTMEYNQKLSARRVESVKTFLEMNYKKGNCLYRTFAEGETRPIVNNSGEENMALNRRVEVRVVRISGGRVTLPGPSKTSVAVNPRMFKGCSVCDVPIKLKYLGNEEEANRAGMPLIAADGTQLMTGGMLAMNPICPEISKADCDTVRFSFPGKLPSRMTGWAFDPESMRWQGIPSTIIYDSLRDLTILEVPNYCWGMNVNADMPKPQCSGEVVIDSTFERAHSRLGFAPYPVLLKDSARIVTLRRVMAKPSLDEHEKDLCMSGFSTFASFAQKGDRYFVLKTLPEKMRETVTELETGDWKILYEVLEKDYKPISPSDTTVVVKLKKKLSGFAPELWVQEFEFAIPLDAPKKKRLTFHYFNYPHQLRLMNGKKAIRSIDLAKVNRKFNRKKKMMKFVVK